AGPSTAAEPMDMPVSAMERPIASRLDKSATRLNATGVRIPAEKPWMTRRNSNASTESISEYVIKATMFTAIPAIKIFLRPILSDRYPPETLPIRLKNEYAATITPVIYSVAPRENANGVIMGSSINKSKKQIKTTTNNNLLMKTTFSE